MQFVGVNVMILAFEISEYNSINIPERIKYVETEFQQLERKSKDQQKLIANKYVPKFTGHCDLPLWAIMMNESIKGLLKTLRISCIGVLKFTKCLIIFAKFCTREVSKP